MDKLDNSYDFTLSFPLDFIIEIGGNFHFGADVNLSGTGLSVLTDKMYPIGYALTWYFRKYHPPDSIIQFRINKVTICDYKFQQECYDVTGYSRIYKYHLFGLKFSPFIPYVHGTLDNSGYVSQDEKTRYFHFESEDNEDLVYEFKHKLVSAYGSYISFKNDFNQICDIPGHVIATGQLVLPTVSSYDYRNVVIRIHLSIRTNN